MAGALPWQVNHLNKVLVFGFGGEMVRGFPALPSSCRVCLQLLFFLSVFTFISSGSAPKNHYQHHHQNERMNCYWTGDDNAYCVRVNDQELTAKVLALLNTSKKGTLKFDPLLDWFF